MSIAEKLLEGFFDVGTSLITGGIQSHILKEGQEEDRKKWATELKLKTAADKKSEKIVKEQLTESKRQFDLSYDLSKERLDVERGQVAQNSFRNQVSNLTNILNKNEQLKNLFVNRLSVLRG